MVARRAVLAVTVGALLAASCSSSKAGVAAVGPTIATAPETTTTTDPYAVPTVIDVAYVNRVLAGLDAAVGDVVRFVVKTDPPPHEITLRLKALYNEEQTALQLEGFHQDRLKAFAGYRDNPGDQRSTVIEVVTGTSHCIFAHVNRDYGPVVKIPNPDLADQWIAVVPQDPARDPDQNNVTGWMYIYDGFEINHARPKNPCDAQS